MTSKARARQKLSLTVTPVNRAGLASVLGLAVAAGGIAMVAVPLAVVVIGVSLVVYGLVFVDVDAKPKRARRRK